MTTKRLLDITGAALGLAILWPVLAAIAVVLKCEGGPIIFRQQRIGQYGKPFQLLKFRTMHPDAQRNGRLITVGNDSRITRVGGCLRRTKLDETLQLVNVLRGEMSLVGPRPEVSKYLDFGDSTHQDILKIQPGITDPATLVFSNEAALLATKSEPEQFYRERLLPMKHQLSLAYARRANLRSDLLILARTIKEVIGARRRLGGGIPEVGHLAAGRAAPRPPDLC